MNGGLIKVILEEATTYSGTISEYHWKPCPICCTSGSVPMGSIVFAGAAKADVR